MSNRKRLLAIFIVLIGIGFVISHIKSTQKNISNDTVKPVVLPSEFVVGATSNEKGEVFGTILATNGATITTSVGGVVKSLSCQPGKDVKKGDIIATFSPSEDLQTENLRVQKDYLSQQVGVYNDSLQGSLQNIDIQIKTLYDQKNTNQQQLALLQQNLENTKKQKELSLGDNDIQLSSLETQLYNIQDQEKADTLKTNDALKNQASSAQTTSLGALTLVDNTFGISDPQLVVLKDPYLGGKDLENKNKVISQFSTMKGITDSLTISTGEKVSNDLQILADYFSLVAKVINSSIADSRYLPQSQIDLLFTSFNGTAQSVIQSKSLYDTTYAGNITIHATYNTQITSLQNQILSLSGNKSQLTTISNDAQINSLQSQINTLQLSLQSFDNQLSSLENSKSIQTQQTNGQLLGVQQNLQIIDNNLGGEILYSPIDGVVKTSSAIIGNKIGQNIPICTIGPKTVESLKAQFFSTRDLPIGQEVFLYDGIVFLGTGVIDYQTLFVDTQTQNKGYEILNLQGTGYQEGQKITIHFDNIPIGDDIRILLPYLKPKLEGYYVMKKDGNEIKVEVGDIDGDYIKILRGIKNGDVIIK